MLLFALASFPSKCLQYIDIHFYRHVNVQKIADNIVLLKFHLINFREALPNSYTGTQFSNGQCHYLT